MEKTSFFHNNLKTTTMKNPVQTTIILGELLGELPDSSLLSKEGIHIDDINSIQNIMSDMVFKFVKEFNDEASLDMGDDNFQEEIIQEDIDEYKESAWDKSRGFVALYKGRPTRKYIEESIEEIDCFKMHKLQSGLWAVFGVINKEC